MTNGAHTVARSTDQLRSALARVDLPLYVLRDSFGLGMAHEAHGEVLATIPALPPQRLGSVDFARDYHVTYAYMGGAMAGGIASVELVKALHAAGCLGSFGAAGLPPYRVDEALADLARSLPEAGFAVNLIHSPNERALERGIVDAALRHRVRVVEASAFMDLTPEIVRYRGLGLRLAGDGGVIVDHRVIAKVSRPETAQKFLAPAPVAIVESLRREGILTQEQAVALSRVPLADDVTVEGDSGGHTDRRPLAPTFSAIAGTRARVARDFPPAATVRLGAAGGLGTPESLAAALTLGADYVVLGSVHQSCRESGTSDAVRAKLIQADIADVIMAPAADMFEMGVELQVLRRGTMFPMRARKLYEWYRAYDSIDAIPAAQRDELEKKILQRPAADVWADTVDYFQQRDPALLERARASEKRQMALIFRWYLGMSSRWAAIGDPSRSQDYQIWTGPALGAFNAWAADSVLADGAARDVKTVATVLLYGAAYALRVQQLAAAGITLPAELRIHSASHALEQVHA